MDRERTRRIFGFLIVLSIALGSFVGLVSSTDFVMDSNQIPSRNGNYNPVMDKSGGEFNTAFSKPSDIEIHHNSEFDSHNNNMNPIPTFEEDAEDHSDGQDLIGINGWIRHDINDTGSFKVAGNRPYSSPTQKAIRHTNPSTSTPSTVITKSMDLSKLSMSFYMYSTEVNVQNLWATRISFIGNDTTNSSEDDMAFSLGIKEGDAYYDNGQLIRISSSANSGQWYSYIVEIDCETQKARISYYRGFYQVHLTTLNNIDIKGAFSSIKRIEFTVQKRVNFQVHTIYDCIEIVDPTDEFYSITPTIELPEGMRWQTLTCDHRRANDAHMTFDILDGDNETVTGLEWNDYFNYLDLSSLNNKGIEEIRIKGVYHWDSLFEPDWRSYSVDWISENGWRDSYLSNANLQSFSGCRHNNQEIVLQLGQKNGYYHSREIELPDNHYWDELYINSTSGNSSFVKIDLIDLNSGKAIPGYHGLNNWKVNLKGIDPVKYDALEIQARFNNEGSDNVWLSSIGLTWFKNTNPNIHDVEFEHSVYRTHCLYFILNVSDLEEEDEDLTVLIDYNEPYGSNWVNNQISEISYDEKLERWIAVFEPDENTTIGNYTFRTRVIDQLGRSDTYIIETNISVMNNHPTTPIIILNPVRAKGFLDITTTMVENSTDIESERLTYNYSFFVNGKEITKERQNGLEYDDTATLDSQYFKKKDEVTCNVHSFDGLNSSVEFSTSVIIDNDAPKVIYNQEIFIELFEDYPMIWDMGLDDIVGDRDDDDLVFDYQTDLDIIIDLDILNGTFFFIPAENYTEDGLVTVNVSDGDENVYFDIQVYMFEEKDPPTGVIISPSSDIRVEVGEEIDLVAEVWDSDTDYELLLVEWRSQSELIGEGVNQSIIYEEPGIYKIECFVADFKTESLIGSLRIEVFKQPLPYEPSELTKEYSGTSTPVVFDVLNIYGECYNASNSEAGWTNITSLTSTTLDDIVLIEMALSQSPIQFTEIPPGVGNGEWCRYNIYFMKTGFQEPEFNQDELKFYSNQFTSPGEGLYYELHESIFYLSTEQSCPYEFEISGNSIIWKVPMNDLNTSGITGDDYNLFGTVVHIKSNDGQMKCGFDTIGYGSKQHIVIVKEVVTSGDDGGSGWMILVIIIILLLLIIGGGLGAFFYFKNNKKGEEVEDANGQDQETPEEEKQEVQTKPLVDQNPMNIEKPNIQPTPVPQQVNSAPVNDPKIGP